MELFNILTIKYNSQITFINKQQNHVIMKKIAEFKQERFVWITNENNSIKYEDPTYCQLYITENMFILVKHINNTTLEAFNNYKEAHKAFTDFATSQLSNE